jgi:preprotein translocase subunit SecE
MQFLKDTLSEFKKVTWPARDMTIGHTIIVIVLCVLVGYYLGFFDGIFSQLLQAIISK